MRKGGVVRIYDSVLMAESRYKCLLVSEQTTAAEVVLMLFRLYGVEAAECTEDYVVCERSTVGVGEDGEVEAETERPLAMDERLMQVSHEYELSFVALKVFNPFNKSPAGPSNVGKSGSLPVRAARDQEQTKIAKPELQRRRLQQ